MCSVVKFLWDAVLIYFSLSLLPVSSCGTLDSRKTLASCFHSTGAGIVARFRRRLLTRSTTCVFGKVVFFSTSSPLSFHDTFGLLWKCFSRRDARDFHVFGMVSITMVSNVSVGSSCSTTSKSLAVVTLGLRLFK